MLCPVALLCPVDCSGARHLAGEPGDAGEQPLAVADEVDPLVLLLGREGLVDHVEDATGLATLEHAVGEGDEAASDQRPFEFKLQCHPARLAGFTTAGQSVQMRRDRAGPPLVRGVEPRLHGRGCTA